MTIPGAGGQVPPRPDQEYRGAQAVAVAPGSTNIVRATQVVVFGTGAGTGLFVYNGTPALGNPPVFWATSASTDPFGNTIPSTAGVAGTAQFRAGNTIINANGTFIYSGTPASNNLIISECPVATTDPFGTATVQGLGVYLTAGGVSEVISAGVQNNIASFFIQNRGSAVTLPPFFGGQAPGGVAGTQAFINSGATSGAAVSSQFELQDSVSAGVTGGLVQVNAGQFNFNLAGTAKWDDNGQQMSLPAGGGPFIGGVGYTGIGLPAGLGGSFFVRLEPNNTVRIRAKLNWTTTSATTFTLTQSLPSAAYYPTAAILLPVTNNATPSALAAPARVFMPTSGAPQVIVPATTGGATTASCDETYANN